jgi:hypothetical protein
MVLTEVSCDFSQLFWANVRDLSHIRPKLLPFSSLPNHYSLITLLFDATQTGDDTIK